MIFNKKNKKEFVHELFDDLAKDYDRINNIMTFGQNLIIKKQIVKSLQIKPEDKILDVCTGTGDLAIFLTEKWGKSVQITGIDFSKNMLDIAVSKVKNFDNIRFIEGDALNLPFPDETFDTCFIGYGLRNLSDLKKGLLELKRVTKKGGFVVNLDLGKPKGFIGKLSKFYLFKIVPLLGKFFHGDSYPYIYLSKSSEDFPSQEELVNIFFELGFKQVKNQNFIFGAIARQIAQV